MTAQAFVPSDELLADNDDDETLEHLRVRWAARPTGQGVTFERTVERLGLTSAVERDALSASIQRLIGRGLVEEVRGTDWHRYRLTADGLRG